MPAPDFRIIALQIMWLMTHKSAFLTEYSDLVQPEYFANQTEQLLVQWALDHWDKYREVISENAIQQLIEDNEDELEPRGIDERDIWRLYENLEKVRSTEYKAVYAQTRAFCKHQGLNVAIAEARQVLKEDGPDAAWAIIDRARTTSRPAEARNVALIGDYKSALKRIGDREADSDYILTGIPKLDAMMEGGLRTGEVAVFLCPTGRGKTMFLCQTASMGLLTGTEVAYYTLEVDRDEIWLRVMASASGAKINELRAWAAAGNSDPEYARMHRSKNSPVKKIETLINRLKLTGNDKIDVLVRDIAVRGATLNTIFGDLEKMQSEGHDPKLIVLDYADRLAANRQYDREHEGQTEIFRDLQAISKEKDIGIWTASQSNRAGLNTADLDLGMIQGAFAKAFEATYVLAAGQNKVMAEHQEFKFLMAKARRSGASQKAFLVKYDLSIARFKSSERSFEGDPDDMEDTAEPMSFQADQPDEETFADRRDEDRARRGQKTRGRDDGE